jgi:predicted nucleotidyltransferase component of viral defense system
MEVRAKLAASAAAAAVEMRVVEKDFVLDYMLAGIASRADLAEGLVFKGGTALRKCLIEGYRFSEDLDFTAFGVPRGKRCEPLLRRAVGEGLALMSDAAPAEADIRRVFHKGYMDGTASTEEYAVEFRLPWPSELCRIKLEICYDEPVVLPPASRSLIGSWPGAPRCRLTCYQVEEVVAEKLRCILQTCRKIDRGTLGATTRARDYYDLWNLLGNFGETLDTEALRRVLEEKCRVRRVSWKAWTDFMRPDLVALVREGWEPEVVQFVGKPVLLDQVMDDLKALLPDFVPENFSDLSKPSRQDLEDFEAMFLSHGEGEEGPDR